MTETQAPQPDTPTGGGRFREAVSLICFMPFYGPPVAFLMAPWLLLGLILSGPFALILTLVLALAAAAALVGGIAALLATPYLVMRRLKTAHRTVARPMAASAQVTPRRVVA